MKKIKVILVDDHNIVRDGLKILLMNLPDIEVIGEVATGADLFDLLKLKMPNVLLMDILLPKMSGIAITEKIRREFPDIKVIMLTASINDVSIIDSFKAGALGYLSKSIQREELIEAIKEVNNGNEYLAKAISETVLDNYKKAKDRTINQHYEITTRELQIIELFTEGLSYKEIADRLNISVRTVESHKNNIFEKLEINSIADLVKYAIRHGIINI
ncbi:MAG: response regulator transcription factor [Bacteroidota bacterium]